MTAQDSDVLTSLNDYWDAVVEGKAAPSGTIDEAAEATIHYLHTHDETPMPDAAFAARLWQELMSRSHGYATPVGRYTHVSHRWSTQHFRAGRKRLLALLGTAAALVFVFVGFFGGLVPWDTHPSIASAQVVISRAQQAMRAITTTAISTAVVTETMEAWPGAAGLSALAGYTGTVSSVSTWWYSAPFHWRAEGHYLIPPHSPALIDGGTLAAAPFAPFPGVVVSDGHTIRSYDPGTNILKVVVLPHVGTNGIDVPFPLNALLGQTANSLSAVLQQANACYTPALHGNDVIAGQDTYVIDLGPSRCLLNSNSAYEVSGRRVLWIDKKTYFVLRSDLYKAGDPSTLLTRTSITGLQENPTVDPTLFTLTPPPGATVLDGSQRPSPTPTPPTPPTLDSLRRSLTYPIFVPTILPAGLSPSQPVVGDPAHTPGVSIAYHSNDGSTALLVLNGPLGCCLDADYRKGGGLVHLPGGIAAHLLLEEPQYGGPILWWDQDGTYIALSGPYLTGADLAKIAESMSKTADPYGS